MQPGRSLMKLDVSNMPTDSGRHNKLTLAPASSRLRGLPWLRTRRSRPRSTPPDPKGS